VQTASAPSMLMSEGSRARRQEEEKT
jgi:hypothetical protein